MGSTGIAGRWQPRVGPSPIHGLGVFATSEIPAGEKILEYVGERITKTESLIRCAASNAFIFALDDQWDLDGNVDWNPARFMNHSCVPNCDAVWRDGGIWIVSRRSLTPGEELTFNYGYDLESYREYPCGCRSPGCAGFMVAEEFLEHVRRQPWRDG